MRQLLVFKLLVPGFQLLTPPVDNNCQVSWVPASKGELLPLALN